MISVLVKGGNLDTEKYIQGECSMKTGGLQRQSKDIPATEREVWNRQNLSSHLQKENALLIL